MPTDDLHPADWFLTAEQRGNPSSRLYADRADGRAWTPGNDVQPLVDGATYFRRLCEELRAVGPGDQVYFVDWRGDPEERLDGPGSAVMVELARAASAGARVFGLVWRSHLDRMRFSEAENRNLAQAMQALQADVVLDMRVRRGGSHHQKFVVVRHPEEPDRDVAFVGGTDLGHSRNDDRAHRGDPQVLPRMAPEYGATPPWHDAMVEIRGPAVADVECCFRERWEDPTALQHDRPLMWLVDRVRGVHGRDGNLPDPLPPPPEAGPELVQLLRTYPYQRPAYPYAPLGERTVARAYAKVLARAEHLVYVEDQYLWSATVASVFADALRRAPGLRLVAVVPRYTDDDSLVRPASEIAQGEAAGVLREAGGDRVRIYDLENEAGTPIYVHAKICVVDDTWASVGSANLNRRSWTHDSELTAAVLTDSPARSSFAHRLRLRLWAEHLGREPGNHHDLLDLGTAPDVLEEQAARLDGWYDGGRHSTRPAGRLRRHTVGVPPPARRRALKPFVRTVVDPDGRPRSWRRANRW